MDNKFYSTIREHYDYIFPLNKAQVDFVKDEFKDKNSKLIEIGCANGKLTNALSDYDIRGIDMEQSFIDMAKERYPKIQFDTLNMIKLYELGETFDGIVCFGNTLVHLRLDEIMSFVKLCYDHLRSGGKLLIQILHYENIIDNDITQLPLIDNEHIKFERRYEFDGSIKFITDLTVKETDEVISNSIYLTPIRKDSLTSILKLAGFKDINIYSSFKKDELKDDSLPLIISCSRD